MLEDIIYFGTLLIGVEGAKTPAGVRGRGDPAGAKSAEEAPRNARGKRSAWNGNQQSRIKKLLNPFTSWLFFSIIVTIIHIQGTNFSE